MDAECVIPKITETCKPACEKHWANYMSCADRIKAKNDGDCEAWYFDYMKCIDKCRVPQIMKNLK